MLLWRLKLRWVKMATNRADLYKAMITLLETHTSATVGAFDEDEVVDNMPFIAIQAPSQPLSRASMGDSPTWDGNGSISLEVYAESMQDVIATVDEIETAIANNALDLPVSNVQLGEGSPASIDLSGRKLRVQGVPVEYRKRW